MDSDDDRLEAVTKELLQERRKSLRLARKLEALKLEYEQASDHRNQLLSSTSWRITAPLRALTVALRGLYSRRRPGVRIATPLASGGSAPASPSEQLPVIIVPIFNAYDEIARCLISLEKNTAADARVLMIDDASTDERVADLLSEYEKHQGWRVIRHPVNRGYTANINLGIDEAGSRDVILLNSDTEVGPGWMARLRQTAYRDADTASVTAVSDNAGAFSIPEPGVANELPDGMGFDRAARWFLQASNHIVSVPTGSGFCMYVRRDAIDAVGKFDEKAFPRGYGEENDWCMRARELGWKHVVDFSVYVRHERSASFGEDKAELLKDGRRVVDKRYPHYTEEVQKVFGSQEMAEAYHAARANFEAALPSRPRVLFVLAKTTGGTPQTNLDLMSGIQSSYETYVLRSDQTTLELLRYDGEETHRLETLALSQPVDPQADCHDQYDAFVSFILRQYSIELMHIRHLGWHYPSVISVAKSRGVPVVFSFHDYYTACPNVKLMDDQDQFCGGVCTPGEGACGVELWRDDQFPDLKHRGVAAWRARMDSALQRCDHFITTSSSAMQVLKGSFPWLDDRPFSIIPHGRDLEISASAEVPEHAEPLRILVPGNITIAKGADILRQVAAGFPSLHVEFHVLGAFAGEQISDERFHFHGKYLREDFYSHVERIRPHAAAVLSVWPETWCHTLTECWACGLPVFAFNTGAVGERIAKSRAGWLTDDLSANGLVKMIDVARRDRDGWNAVLDAVSGVPSCAGVAPDIDEMAASYDRIYHSLPGLRDVSTLGES